MNGLAINVDYRYSTQELRSTAVEFDGTPTFDVDTELHTETVRLEYVPLNVLSVYAVVARHDGTSKLDALGSRQSLDGWGFGAGLNAAIAPETPFTFPVSRLEVTPLGLYDFTYTYNDFHAIKSGVDTYTTTGRLAGLLQHPWCPAAALTIFGGANFQAQNKIQTVGNPLMPGTNTKVANNPDDSWAPVVGMALSRLMGGRPDLTLLFEAALGDRREHFLLSFRYEFWR